MSSEVCFCVVTADGVRSYWYDEAGRIVAFRYESLAE